MVFGVARSFLTDMLQANANKYWTLNEQVLFNLSNLFCGYSETRVWNLIPYAGGGLNRNMSLQYSTVLAERWYLERLDV